MKSVMAAVQRATSDAMDVTPTVWIGTVSEWNDPRATVDTGSSSIPKIRATAEAAANITVGSVVVVLMQGSLTVIIGTI